MVHYRHMGRMWSMRNNGRLMQTQWIIKTAGRLGVESSLRLIGRSTTVNREKIF